MEKLELKHLAPYLPYGLKCQAMGEHKIDAETPLIFRLLGVESTMGRINCKLLCGILPINPIINEVFPILRPLSDLSKSIQIAEFYASFIIHIKRITGFEIDIDLDIDSGYLQSSYIEFSDYQLMLDFLYEKHFDVFGLIEKGLAIDINTLEK